MHLEIGEHLRAGGVLARVDRQSEIEVRVDGIGAAILEVVGAQLAEQADAAALMSAQIEHDAAALGRDRCHRRVQLRAAVAPVGAEHVARQAFGVHAHQGVLAVPAGSADVAEHQGNVLSPVHRVQVAERPPVAELVRHPGLDHPSYGLLGVAAVLNQLGDGDQREAMLVGECAQLRKPGHRAVVVEDLGDHAGLGQAGEPGQVHRGLGVPGAAQYAALGVAQREDMAGPDDLVRLGG